MYQYDDWNEVAREAPEQADDPAAAGPAADAMGVVDEAAPEAGASALADGQSAGDSSERADLTASFLAEIARAMRATAIQERERISTTVADETVAHEQKVRERGTSEASELRRLADDDLERIQRTAADEIQRIKDDAEHQIGERRGVLADHLRRHAALIETEIGRVRGAVDDYGAELDGFFGRLAREQSPAEIARLAGLLPEPPDLDQVGAMARADAVGEIADEATAEAAEAAEAAEPAEASEPAGEIERAGDASPVSEPDLVGVMDHEAGTAVFDESVAPADVEAVPAGAIAEDEPGPAGSDADAPSGGISAARLLRNLAQWTSSDRPSNDSSDSTT
jgi:hypothetical protein